MKKDQYGKAVADYSEAVGLYPNHSSSLNSLAWSLATCPEDKYRDGKKAFEVATKGCELADWNDPGLLDTLAAASAEAGDFEAAGEMADEGDSETLERSQVEEGIRVSARPLSRQETLPRQTVRLDVRS